MGCIDRGYLFIYDFNCSNEPANVTPNNFIIVL